jgi:hypothetical protein
MDDAFGKSLHRDSGTSTVLACLCGRGLVPAADESWSLLRRWTSHPPRPPFDLPAPRELVRQEAGRARKGSWLGGETGRRPRARLAGVSIRCMYAPGIREITDASIDRARTSAVPAEMGPSGCLNA